MDPAASQTSGTDDEGIPIKTVDWANVVRILERIDQSFKEPDFSDSVPFVASMLSTVDSSNVTSFTDIPQFAKVNSDFVALDEALASIIDRHFAIFNRTITNFSALLRMCKAYEEHLATLKENTTDAKRLLFNAKVDLPRLWSKAEESKEIMRVLDLISELAKAPSTIDDHVTNGEWLMATKHLTRSLHLIHTADVTEIGALHDLREQLLQLKQQLQEILGNHLDMMIYSNENSSNATGANATGNLSTSEDSSKSAPPPLTQAELMFAKRYGWSLALSQSPEDLQAQRHRSPNTTTTSLPPSLPTTTTTNSTTPLLVGGGGGGGGGGGVSIVASEMRVVVACDALLHSPPLSLSSLSPLGQRMQVISECVVELGRQFEIAQATNNHLRQRLHMALLLAVRRAQRETAHWAIEVSRDRFHEGFLNHVLALALPTLKQILNRHLLVMQWLQVNAQGDSAYNPTVVWECIQTQVEALVSEHFGVVRTTVSGFHFIPELVSVAQQRSKVTDSLDGLAAKEDRPQLVGLSENVLSYSIQQEINFVNKPSTAKDNDSDDDDSATSQSRADADPMDSSLPPHMPLPVQIEPSPLLVGPVYQPLKAFVRGCVNMITQANYATVSDEFPEKPLSEVEQQRRRDETRRLEESSQLSLFLDQSVETLYLPTLKAELTSVVSQLLRTADVFVPLNDRSSAAALSGGSPPQTLMECVVMIDICERVINNILKMPKYLKDLLQMLDQLLNTFLEKCREVFSDIVGQTFAGKLISNQAHVAFLQSDPCWQETWMPETVDLEEFDTHRERMLLSNAFFLEEVNREGWPTTITLPPIRTRPRIRQVAAIAHSMRWLSERLSTLIHQRCATLKTKGRSSVVPPPPRDNSMRPPAPKSQGKQPANAPAQPKQNKEPSSVDMTVFCEKALKLSHECILALRLDLRSRCYLRLAQLMKDYLVTSDNQQPDAAVNDLLKDMAEFGADVSIYLQPQVISYLFGSAPQLMGFLVIHHLKHIIAINDAGVQLMCRNVSSLQHNLTLQGLISQADCIGLEKARQYYRLLALSNEAFQKQLGSVKRVYGSEMANMMQNARESTQNRSRARSLSLAFDARMLFPAGGVSQFLPSSGLLSQSTFSLPPVNISLPNPAALLKSKTTAQ